MTYYFCVRVFIRWNPDNKNYRDLIHDISSLDKQLVEIFVDHNGIKALDYQLPDKLAVHLLQRRDCRILFLRRNDLLQSVVSVLIAKQTQVCKRWEVTNAFLPNADEIQEFCGNDVTGWLYE